MTLYTVTTYPESNPMTRYQEMQSKAKSASRVDVTEEEFVAAMMAEGVTEADARLQAKVGKGLGSSCLVGDRMLRIKDVTA